ncbi:MAG: hypothetical protein ACT4P6_05275 [Gemmatimonadaceae bacterium]
MLPRLTRWSRRLHRWLAWGLGILVAMWVITGVFMILPSAPVRFAPLAPIDATAAVRSPNEAALALPSAAASRVRTVSRRNLGGSLLYHFVLQNGRHVFVDATTARRVEFSDTLARAIARAAIVGGEVGPPLTRLERHDRRYRTGPLPAYRFQLNNSDRTMIHVSAGGTVNATSRYNQFRAMMGRLHQFELPLIHIPSRPRRAALVVTSVITVVLVVTGYVLVFPLRRRSAAE